MLKKIYEKFFLRFAIGLLVCLFCTVHASMAMDSGNMTPDDILVWQVILNNASGQLDFVDKHSFAVTNKNNYELVCSDADKRKNVLKEYIKSNHSQLTNQAKFFWCKSGSNVDIVDIMCIKEDDQVEPNALYLGSFSLQNDGSIVKKEKVWDKFYPLSHNPLPFLNEKKEVCFLGYGHCVGPYRSWSGIYEYNMCRKFMCVAVIGKKIKDEYSVCNFWRYPLLLQKILSSTKVTRACHFCYSDWKIYYIAESVFSDDDLREELMGFLCDANVDKKLKKIIRNIVVKINHEKIAFI